MCASVPIKLIKCIYIYQSGTYILTNSLGLVMHR